MKNSEILRILMPERTKQIALAWSILRSAELFGETDLDGTWTISDVEFYNDIYDSPKHGSDAYRKADQDQSKSLDIQECATDLHRFAQICTSGNHIENIFKRTDQDGSRELNLQETNS